MSKGVRDMDIGKPTREETFREVITDLKIDTNISENKATSAEILSETKRIRRANEFILGQEVEESE
ncbi:hypothetical protein LCGC14_1242750 [marine sediment metagenome]|uniref:Uncharacterized protein n=1 Tax=marine sediment metagenome TaxID=412755 RepID=A0A0F9L990_9ZZZZ